MIMIILALSCLAFYLLLKQNNLIQNFTSLESLKSYILSFGTKAPVMFGMLQFVQVIISPIPGNITTLAGGVIFGFWQGFFISAAAIILGSICAFILSRVFGKTLIDWLIGSKTLEKYLNVANNKRKLILCSMFLLPFFPDDALCMVCGLSNMSFKHFVLCVFLTRPIGLIISTLIGANIIIISTIGWVFIALISLLFAFAVFYIKAKYKII